MHVKFNFYTELWVKFNESLAAVNVTNVRVYVYVYVYVIEKK